jgi:hypothetical protein
MEKKNHNSLQHEPLKLVRNVTYPTYQLYAVAVNDKKLPAEKIMTIAILETLNWLRQRFRDFEVPSQLDLPDSSKYEEVDFGSFKSFYIDKGYKVEVIWLPEEQIWTLQLTEPDLGPNPGSEENGRLPVPGRIFETNIAYRNVSGEVECGFRTLVSEPEGTAAPCEVFRLSLIKHLARNNIFGLRHGYNLSDYLTSLDSLGSIKLLKEWIKNEERMMSVIIVSECKPEKPNFSSIIAQNMQTQPVYTKKTWIPNLTQLENQEQDQRQKKFPINAENLARFKLGYAQIFTLPLSLIETFNKNTGSAIQPGDVTIFEPIQYGGAVKRYPYNPDVDSSESLFKTIEEYANDYLKGKPMLFGQVVFLSKAKDISSEKLINLKLTREELIKAFEEKTKAQNNLHNEELREYQLLLTSKDEKIGRLNNQIDEIEYEKALLRDEIETVKKSHCIEIDKKDIEIKRYIALLNRPKTPDKMVEWANCYFQDKLIFHQKACEMLDNLPPNSLDLNQLCDAVEFLATDYRDELIGEIHIDEMKNRCSQKYNKPFEVTPVSDVTLGVHAKEYKIKYGLGHTGKPVEKLLDLHMRVYGDKRIYFLYDKDNKLIVIGSLPEHLSTVTFK